MKTRGPRFQKLEVGLGEGLILVLGDQQPRPVGQRHLRLAVARHVGEIHQISLVDPEEPAPQRKLQIPESGVVDKLAVPQVDDYLVVAALQVVDVLQRHGPAGPGGLEHQRPGRGRSILPEGRRRPGKDPGELRLVHGLEQILEGAHVKGVEDVAVIAGDKDDHRLCPVLPLPQRPGQGHPVGSLAAGRQPDVQEEQIRRPGVRQAGGSGAVFHDLRVPGLGPNQGGQVFPGRLLIVANGDSHPAVPPHVSYRTFPGRHKAPRRNWTVFPRHWTARRPGSGGKACRSSSIRPPVPAAAELRGLIPAAGHNDRRRTGRLLPWTKGQPSPHVSST